MTEQEIRAAAPKEAIWMADAAIRKARRALCGKTGWNDVHRADYNLPEVEMASAVLCRLFNTFEAAIRMALIWMPEEMDGAGGGLNYFGEFVRTLEEHLKTYTHPEEVTLRQEDWTLEAL